MADRTFPVEGDVVAELRHLAKPIPVDEELAIQDRNAALYLRAADVIVAYEIELEKLDL